MTTLEIILLGAVILLLVSLVVTIVKAKSGMDGMRETLKHSSSFREEADKARKMAVDRLQEQIKIADQHRDVAIDYGQMLLMKRMTARERREIQKYLDQAAPRPKP